MSKQLPAICVYLVFLCFERFEVAEITEFRSVLLVLASSALGRN